jgi:hypothetical protein
MTLPSDPTLAGPAGVLEQDVPCRKCSYNLRGLSIDGRCPECNTAVGYSIKGDLLQFSDPVWVDKLARGVSLILWGIVVWIGAAIFTVIVAAVTKTSPVLLGALIGLAAHALFIYGSWLLTEPDPSGVGEDQYGISRKIIRVTIVIGAVQAVINLTSRFGGASMPFLQVIGLCAGLVGAVGVVSWLYYFERLAQRIPDLALSKRAHYLMYGLGISYTLMLFLQLGIAVLGRGTMRAAGMTGAGCAGAIVVVVVFILGIDYLFFLIKLAKRFRAEAQIARQTWSSAGAAG